MLTQIISTIVAFLLGLIIAWPIGKWWIKRGDKKLAKKLKNEEVEVRKQIIIEEQVQKGVENARKERREGAGERDRNKEGERRKLLKGKLRAGEQGSNTGTDNIEDKDTSREQRGIPVSEDATNGTADSISGETERDTKDDWPDFS